jgi:hypothetical protein
VIPQLFQFQFNENLHLRLLSAKQLGISIFMPHANLEQIHSGKRVMAAYRCRYIGAPTTEGVFAVHASLLYYPPSFLEIIVSFFFTLSLSCLYLLYKCFISCPSAILLCLLISSVPLYLYLFRTFITFLSLLGIDSQLQKKLE